MLNLFLKDVRAGALFLWAVVPLNALAELQMSRSGAGFFWVGVTCAALILVGVSMLEWKHDAEPFVHSLPVTRAMVVCGRYVTAAAIGMLSLIVAAAVGTARGLGLAVQGAPWPRWVSGDMALAFLLAFSLIAVVYLPCFFRWGFGKGNVAAACVLTGGIIVSDVMGPAAASVPGLAGRSATHAGLPPGRIPHGIAVLVEQAGLGAAGIIVLALAAGLLALSARVSIRAYERREF
jgi:hypothetical protein